MLKLGERTINQSLNILSCLLLMLSGVASAAEITPPTVTQPLQKAVLKPASTLTVSWSTPAQGLEEEIATSFDLFVRDGVSKEIVWRERALTRETSCNVNGDCSIVLPVALPESKSHYLRIRAKSGEGYSAWSALRYFSVLNADRQSPAQPLVVLPEHNGLIDLAAPIEVSWQLAGTSDPLRDPTAYDFLVYDRLSRSIVSRQFNVSGIGCDVSRRCTYQLPNQLPEAKNHFVRVRARNLAGVSVWTPVRRFSVINSDRVVPSTPVITLPIQWQTFDKNQALNFRWTAVEGLSGLGAPSEFDVFVYDTVTQTFLWRSRHLAADVHCDEVGACNVDIPVALPVSEGYVFRVKAKNVVGQSSWSRSTRFSVYQPQALVFSGSCTAAVDASVVYSDSISHLVSGGEGPYTFDLHTSPSRGSVDLDYNSGSFVYYPSDSGRGYMDSFDVRVRDQNGQEATADVSFVFGTRRIMPVGDSITFGVLNYNNTTGDFPLSVDAVGYRQHLKVLLQAGGYATEFVGPRSSGASAGLSDSRHAGYPGWTSVHIANGRPGYSASGHLTHWLDDHAADVLLIHAGTNDHSTNTYGVGQILAKADAWGANNNLPLISMTATLVDQRRDYWNRNHLDIYNASVLWEVAAVSSARLVDMFPELDWRGDLTTYPTDITGLHPNAGGYLKMAEKWYHSLVEEGVVSKCP